MIPTVIQPLGYSAGTCGYCSEPGKRSKEESSFTTGAWPTQLTCDIYQRMLDRGWRRSGEYLYKPDLTKSCCRQYTIRLSALEFSASKGHRKIVNKWNRYILDDNDKKGGSKKPGKGLPQFSLVDALHASEDIRNEPDKVPAHKFSVTLESPIFTQEKFNVYCQYQAEVHKDLDKAESGFTRFLVDSPLIKEPISYARPPPTYLPTHFGAYHQMYRVDGELVAVGIIDILPNCVSSVYFMYLPQWSWASLGKLSALREIALAQEMHDYGLETMKWQYMGFYVHTCTKMRYKGEYSPSYLLDPEDYTWHDFASSAKQLDSHFYVSFSNPNHFRDIPAPGSGERLDSIPDLDSSAQLASESEEDDHEDDVKYVSRTGTIPKWDQVKVVEDIVDGSLQWVPALFHDRLQEKTFENLLRSAVEGVGEDIAEEIFFWM